MKKIFAILILSFLIFTSCIKKETKESSYDKIINRDILIAGVKTDSKPFGYISNITGEPEGFDVDIAKIIAQDILGSERKIKFVSVDPNTKIEALTSGEVDIVVATMSVTPQRELFVDFSVPYYFAGQTALVPEDSSIYTFADLKDKTTIVVLGTTAEKNIRRIIPTAKIIGYQSYKEAFEAFLNGDGDAISSDNTILAGFLIDHPGYRLLKNKITKEPYAVAFAKPQFEGDDKLKNSINVVINRLHKDGTLNKLKQKWKLK